MEGLSLNLLENTDMHSIALKHANENGFTLIEALIATVLLVIGLLSYASFTGNLVVQNTKNDRKTMAVSYAQEKLEDLKNDALDAPLASTTSAYPNTPDTGFSDDPDNGIFHREWWIANGGAGSLTTLQVVVEWDDINGLQSFYYATLLSQ